MIILKNQTDKAIRTQGEKTYPDECCGFVLGQIDNENNRVVTEIIPARNTSPETEKHHRFGIDPAEFARNELYARKNKIEILGIYHSHPDHPAKPSEFDLLNSQLFYSYVIVSVDKGVSAVMTSWILNNDRKDYTEEKIIIP
jgi:proteasome lid subunit RPN8/RPN11